MSKIRYFEARRGRVEIIPMIDVMLFLLVFFIMITLQMIPDSGVVLQLPQSSQSNPLPPPRYTVNIQQDGSLILKGKPITDAALTALLENDGNPTHTQVTIAAAKQVAFQKFIKVMDDCRAAGVTDIGVATQPTAPGSATAPADAPAAAAAAPAAANP